MEDNMNNLGITWRDVFDGNKIAFKSGFLNVYAVIDFVYKNTDYDYIAWNGLILTVNGDFDWEKDNTGLTVNDI